MILRRAGESTDPGPCGRLALKANTWPGPTPGQRGPLDLHMTHLRHGGSGSTLGLGWVIWSLLTGLHWSRAFDVQFRSWMIHLRLDAEPMDCRTPNATNHPSSNPGSTLTALHWLSSGMLLGCNGRERPYNVHVTMKRMKSDIQCTRTALSPANSSDCK